METASTSSSAHTMPSAAGLDAWPSLLKQARARSAAADSVLATPPLQGMHLALVCTEEAAGAAHMVGEAARDLGARVAHLRPLPETSQSELRVLAQLYRAVACEGLTAELVRQLAQAGLPVCNRLASADHPARVLADVLAIQDGAAAPLATLALALVGHPDSALVVAWQNACALSGMRLLVLAPEDVAERDVNAVATHVKADIVCDLRLPPCDDGRPQLWLRRPGASQLTSLAPEQAIRHRHLVQALLLRELG